MSQDNFGPFSPATQEYLQIYAENRDLNLKQAFVEDLTKLLSNNQCEHLIMGDFNSAAEVTFVQSLMLKNDLVDVIRVCGREEHHNIPTYSRGKTRIDYALASWGLIPDVEEAFYDDFEDYTDHRALIVQLKWDISHVAPNRMRILHTKQFRRSLKYRKKMWTKCERRRIPEILEKLKKQLQSTNKLTKRQIHNLSQIDRILTYIMVKQGKGYKIPFHNPWSPELDKKYKIAKFYMLWWRYCKKQKEATKRKLLKLSTLELFFDNNKPKSWVREQFNAEVADLRRKRHNAQQERDNFINDEIDAGLLKQDMTRVKILEQIKCHEDTKRSFSRLSRVLEKPQKVLGSKSLVMTDERP